MENNTDKKLIINWKMESNFVTHAIAHLRTNMRKILFIVSVAANKLITIQKLVSQTVRGWYFVNYVCISLKFKRYNLKKVEYSIKEKNYKNQNMKKINFKRLNKSQIQKYHKFRKFYKYNKKVKRKHHQR